MDEHLLAGLNTTVFDERLPGSEACERYAKTVITEVGPVEVQMPRDRNGSFDPGHPPENVRRLDGLSEQVISLFAKGMTTATVEFDAFADRWRGKYPAMILSWENSWNEFVPFLEFPVELRRIVYTTNAIERLNARFRKAVRHRGHFPNEQSAMKVSTSSRPPAARTGRTSSAASPAGSTS